MTAQPKPLLTAEQFFDLGDIGPAELIDGEVIRLSPMYLHSSVIAAQLLLALHRHVAAHRLGAVYPAGTGFRLAPHRVQSPDIAFVVCRRLADPSDRGFVDGAPDLAVEVLGTPSRPRDIREKCRDWLKHGARSVWVVDPDTRTIAVSRSDGTAAVFGEADSLRDPAVFPKLKLKVKDVFARPW